MNKVPHAGTVDSLNTGSAVGIAVVTTAVVIFIAGVLTGVLFYHCISNHQSQSSKPVSASNQLQQMGPEYEEVVILSENVAYRPTQSIELRTNEAYQHVQQWFAVAILIETCAEYKSYKSMQSPLFMLFEFWINFCLLNYLILNHSFSYYLITFWFRLSPFNHIMAQAPNYQLSIHSTLLALKCMVYKACTVV